MLSIIKSTKDQTFALFSSGSIEEGFDINITDGKLVWYNISKIDFDCRPASRKRDSKDNFMNSLSLAFSPHNSTFLIGGRRFEYDFTVSEGDNQLSIVVKEQLPGTTTLSLLFKDTFIPKDNAAEAMMQIIVEFSTLSNKKDERIRKVQEESNNKDLFLEQYKESIKMLTEKAITGEDVLLQNATLVLNTKKREIEYLRSQGNKGTTAQSTTTIEQDDEEEEIQELPKAKRAATTRKPAASKAKTGNTAVDKILQKVKKGSATTTTTTTKKAPAKRGRKQVISEDEEEEEAESVFGQEEEDDITVDSVSHNNHNNHKEEESTDEEIGRRGAARSVRAKKGAKPLIVSSLPVVTEEDMEIDNPTANNNDIDDDVTVLDSDEELVVDAMLTTTNTQYNDHNHSIWSMSDVKTHHQPPAYSFPSAFPSSSSSSSSSVFPPPLLPQSSAPSVAPLVQSHQDVAIAEKINDATSITSANVNADANGANTKKKRTNRFFEDSDDD